MTRRFLALDANWNVGVELYTELSAFMPGVMVDARAWRRAEPIRLTELASPRVERLSDACWKLSYRFPPGWFHTLNRLSMPALARSVAGRGERLLGERPSVLLVSSPYYLRAARAYRAECLVYHVLDDYRWYWPRLASQTSALEARLVHAADLTVCVSRYYCQQLRSRFPHVRDRIVHLPNGVTQRFLDEPHPKTARDIQQKIAGLPRPLFCYTGDPAGRLESRMVQALVDATEGAVVIAGPRPLCEPYASMGKVVPLGLLDAAETAALLRASDVLIIPQADTPFNRATSPRKLWEYCASGTPVVGSCLTEVDPTRDGIVVVEDADEFVRAALHLANGGDSREARAARRRLAEDRRYPLLAAKLAGHIEGVMDEGAATSARSVS